MSAVLLCSNSSSLSLLYALHPPLFLSLSMLQAFCSSATSLLPSPISVPRSCFFRRLVSLHLASSLCLSPAHLWLCVSRRGDAEGEGHEVKGGTGRRSKGGERGWVWWRLRGEMERDGGRNWAEREGEREWESEEEGWICSMSPLSNHVNWRLKSWSLQLSQTNTHTAPGYKWQTAHSSQLTN